MKTIIWIAIALISAYSIYCFDLAVQTYQTNKIQHYYSCQKQGGVWLDEQNACFRMERVPTDP